MPSLFGSPLIPDSGSSGVDVGDTSPRWDRFLEYLELRKERKGGVPRVWGDTR